RARLARGHLHHVLVLARLGVRADRRAGPRPGAVREDPLLRQPAAVVRRGDRRAQRPPPRQLPPGLHPPGADQRGDAGNPRRTPRTRGPVRLNTTAYLCARLYTHVSLRTFRIRAGRRMTQVAGPDGLLTAGPQQGRVGARRLMIERQLVAGPV